MKIQKDIQMIIFGTGFIKNRIKSIANIIHQKSHRLIIRDSNGNRLYVEGSDGFWVKRQFDKNCKETYYENSAGDIEDNRP